MTVNWFDSKYGDKQFSLESRDDLTFLSQYVVFPGFCDVHVHYRQPGFSYKETIESGSKAAAKGGYTTVCAMPNLNPVADSLEHIALEQQLIDEQAVIEVLPYAAITINQKGEQLVDMEALASCCVAFSDDGKGVQSEEMMKQAMLRAKALDKIIVAHCEVDSLLKGGYIHDGIYAKEHGHKGICSQSEWQEVERDVKLAKETGCKFHVCHVSTKESVEIIRQGKKAGVDVTCETAPHYLLLDEGDLKEDGRFKMNPPLRSKEDRKALIEGIKDGTIDMIATDHAPHSKEEKSKGLKDSAFGISGIETAFPLIYTYLVKTGIITMEKAVALLCDNPRKRFNLKAGNDFSIWNLDEEYTIKGEEFISQGKATPFEGRQVYGKCLLTVKDGQIVYENI